MTEINFPIHQESWQFSSKTCQTVVYNFPVGFLSITSSLPSLLLTKGFQNTID